jgi:hypothetical protein
LSSKYERAQELAEAREIEEAVNVLMANIAPLLEGQNTLNVASAMMNILQKAAVQTLPEGRRLIVQSLTALLAAVEAMDATRH